MVGGDTGQVMEATMLDEEDAREEETAEYLVMRVNEMRAYYRRAPVVFSPTLACAARSWAKTTWRLRYCGHVDMKTGQQFWQRVNICGGRLTRGYELVSCEVPSIEMALADWLNEPSSRKILLSPFIQRIGIGWAGSDKNSSRKYYTLVADGD